MGKLELRLEFMLETDDEDDDKVVFLVRPLATPGHFRYVIFLKPGWIKRKKMPYLTHYVAIISLGTITSYLWILEELLKSDYISKSEFS